PGPTAPTPEPPATTLVPRAEGPSRWGGRTSSGAPPRERAASQSDSRDGDREPDRVASPGHTQHTGTWGSAGAAHLVTPDGRGHVPGLSTIFQYESLRTTRPCRNSK